MVKLIRFLLTTVSPGTLGRFHPRLRGDWQGCGTAFSCVINKRNACHADEYNISSAHAQLETAHIHCICTQKIAKLWLVLNNGVRM